MELVATPRPQRPWLSIWFRPRRTLLNVAGFGAAMVAAFLTFAWSLVLAVACLAEAHRFSVWRALATYAIPTAVVVAVLAVVL